jgi:phenylacetate-CoA ligase
MLSDWKKVPVLNKDDLRRASEDLIAHGYNKRKLITSSTSGSTGMPLRCYHDHETLLNIYAAFWEYARPGVKLNDRYAAFSGIQLIPLHQIGGPYWRMNRAMNQRLYSIFHFSKKTIKDFIDDLDAYEPVYIEGYAHSLYLLAKLAEEVGITPKWSPKAVFTTSEQLLDNYRDIIQRVFRTKVWDAYSQDESCGSISEYECGYYHYDRAYGYMEFEDLEINNNRRLAEIICTGFLNNAWPILRYRIGDVVEYEPVEICPRCGRAGPIIHKIRGRISDTLTTPSGRYYPYINRIIKPLHGLREIQLVQESIDKVIIRYVPSEDFQSDKDEAAILKTFQQAIREPIHWSIERVGEISRTQAGKFKMIISKI